MLAVVTALKVPKPVIQGNSTFEVLWGIAAQTAVRVLLRVRARAGCCFGGDNKLSPLIRMDLRSVVTAYVPVSGRYIIGLRVIVASYRSRRAGASHCGAEESLGQTKQFRRAAFVGPIRPDQPGCGNSSRSSRSFSVEARWEPPASAGGAALQRRG
jgi:hypothetical protein